MTDDKKHDDKDRKKLSDEEMEDVAGGAIAGPQTYIKNKDFSVSKKKDCRAELDGIPTQMD